MNTGTRPNTSPVTIATAVVKPMTVQSTPMPVVLAIAAGLILRSSRCSRTRPAVPRTPPAVEMIRLSARRYRARRHREAPSAMRRANSRCRWAARARIEVGDVDAGDEQQHADSAEEHQERRPRVAVAALVPGHDDGRRLLRIHAARLIHARLDGRELRVRRLNRRAGGQPAEQLVVPHDVCGRRADAVRHPGTVPASPRRIRRASRR